LQVPVGQAIVSEADLRLLHDRLYRLESAVEDVHADLGGKPSARAYRDALEHLLDAAQDLVGVVVEPVRE
jgi:F0F1-type ATP synthase beta subunit